MELVCFVLDEVTNVHLKVEVTDDGHETVFLFIETKDVLFQIESQLQLVASLLDEKHALRRVILVVKVEHGLDPLVVHFLLLLC